MDGMISPSYKRQGVIWVKVEVPDEVKEFLEKLKDYEPVEDELLFKQAFSYGLDSIRKEYAIKLFSKDKVSIGEGAELANLSVGEYLELLASRGIKSKVTIEDYQKGLEYAADMLAKDKT